MDRHKSGQIDELTHRQIDRQITGLTHKWTDGQMNRQIDRQMNEKAVNWTGR